MGSINTDSNGSSATQPPYPLHPSIRDKLDPVYKEFYNKHLINQQQVHLRPVAESRTSGVLIPGAGPKLPVGSVEDISIPRLETKGPEVLMRAFTPEGEKPDHGWPLFVWYHGGGWVLGNIDTENVICTNLCNRSRCVVVTVDYRLAPESPYPAAVHDSWEALLWLKATGITHLSLNPSLCAVGGSSAGGNLAAIMCHKALSSPSSVPNFLTQLLIVPVMDNTATPANTLSWKENEFVCALPAEKMLWYRRHYLPDESTWAQPEASPLFYGDGNGEWGRLPRALVVVGGLDVLRSEGEAYAAKLESNGVKVDLRIHEGLPHPFVAMDEVLKQGRDTITFMVDALNEAFGVK
ncbi:AB hydrolase superfamily protein [Lachnellula suecica]|uniref:AB hydrolase superfamily protein n=1 Tax=Lachnellula suecica TaxID=602035 RepID=A0A8T9C729_9HELO|nr:AB hydrolase superfamily protein [Lachnellula suecica]